MAEARTLRLRKGAFKVRLWTAGEGPPLLYLHGVTGLDGWPSWLDAFTATHRVVAPELPGFGSSTGVEHLDSFLDLALYHLDLMEALGIERATIIGHWLGGAIAAEIAALCPHAVDRLVLVAPTGLFDEQDPGLDIFATTEAELEQALWRDVERARRRGLVPQPRTPR